MSNSISKDKQKRTYRERDSSKASFYALLHLLGPSAIDLVYSWWLCRNGLPPSALHMVWYSSLHSLDLSRTIFFFKPHYQDMEQHIKYQLRLWAMLRAWRLPLAVQCLIDPPSKEANSRIKTPSPLPNINDFDPKKSILVPMPLD